MAAVRRGQGVSEASTAESETQSKRKLEEESEAEMRPTKTQETYVKHETHWILDGNVLLQIKNVRFKVHRSRLASQSDWFEVLFERRKGNLTNDDFEDLQEIEKVLESAEVVDGYDLFYLDDFSNYGKCPSIEEFSDLLEAMDSAIAYMHQPPPFPKLRNIYVASTFYHFDMYCEAIRVSIRKVFPDDPQKITAHITSTSYAVAALKLRHDFRSLKKIIRCAFYQLARNLPKPTVVDSDGSSFGAEDGTGDTLDSLPAKDLILLMNAQKELALCWDSIVGIVEPTCTEQKCVRSRATNTAVAMRKKYLFDPIYGIQILVLQDWSSKGFCSPTEKEVIAKLKKERAKIWEKLHGWLEINDD